MVKVAQAYESVRTRMREKEVEPDGHGEATRGHELNLHELASLSSTANAP
jgi:hypothetical protein